MARKIIVAAILSCAALASLAQFNFSDPAFIPTPVVSSGSSCTAGTNTLTVNLLAKWADTANVTFYESPSFTPSTNALLMFAQAWSPTGTDTLTNTGSTQLTWWKKTGSETNYDTLASPAHTLSVWFSQLPQGTAPFAMTLVAKHGSGTGIGGIVFEVTGTDQTAAYGSNAIVQSVAFGANASADPTNKFAAPGNNGSNTLIFVVGDDSNSGANNAPTLSWTELWETNYNTPAAGVAVYYSNMVPSSVTTATNTATSRDWGTVVVEVKAGTNCNVASSAVTFDGSSSGSTNDLAGDFMTVTTHSVGSNPNGIILFGLTQGEAGGTPTITGVPYCNGVAMTLVTNKAPSTTGLVSLYRLLSPSSGAQTITFTNTAGAGNCYISWWAASAYNVNQSTFARTVVANSGSGTTSSATVASDPNDLVICIHGGGSSFSAVNNTAIGSHSGIENINDFSSCGNGAGNRSVGSSSVSMTGTLGSDSWATCAISLRP